MKRRQSLGPSDDSLKKSLGCSLALNHRLYGGNIISKFIKECFIHHCQYVFIQLLNINLQLVKIIESFIPRRTYRSKSRSGLSGRLSWFL